MDKEQIRTCIATFSAVQKVLYFYSLLTLPFVSSALSTDYKVTSVQEIKDALKNIQPGDNIILANGTWTDASIVFEGKGTAEKPITLKSETAGQVILNGSSDLKIAGDYLIVDGLIFNGGFTQDKAIIEFRKGSKTQSNYSRLTNTAIVDYNPSNRDTSYHWVSLYGTRNRVDHCYFRNKTNHGCLLVVWLGGKPNHHLIDSNYFGYRPEFGRNGAETIRIGDSNWSMSDSYTTVECNYFEECNGEREIISNKSCNNIYRYNTFIACQGALTLRHGNNCTVEGNYFFGREVKRTGGIRVIGENHRVINNYLAELRGDGSFSTISLMNGVPKSPLNRYFQVKNALIAFNTLVNNKSGIEIGVGADNELSLSPTGCVIANNIVVGTNAPLVMEISKPENFKWDGNIFYGADPGIKLEEGITQVDPKLKLGLDSLYRPQRDSPAIGAAKGSYDFVKEDFDGQRRPQKKDVGCDQSSDKPINRRSILPVDTGYIWKFFR
jgi:poly(beta-D-mannuronate) lyase